MSTLKAKKGLFLTAKTAIFESFFGSWYVGSHTPLNRELTVIIESLLPDVEIRPLLVPQESDTSEEAAGCDEQALFDMGGDTASLSEDLPGPQVDEVESGD